MGWFQDTDPILQMARKWPEDGRRATLLESYTYTDNRGIEHTARQGLRTDGGSIPRFFWRAIEDPFGFSLPAYLVHDQECDDARKIENPEKRKTAFACADEMFGEMLVTLKTPAWKRVFMIRGVKLGHAI